MRDILRIESKHLALRPLTAADAARVACFTSDRDVSRMLARVPFPNPLIAVEGWLLIHRARARLNQDFVFAIDLAGEGLVGVVGAHRSGPASVEIGYWLGRPYWGRGLASEAVGAFVAEAQKLGPLEAGHFFDNPASGRVLQKAGFAYTGEKVPLFSMARGERVLSHRMTHAASRALHDRPLEACA